MSKKMSATGGSAYDGNKKIICLIVLIFIVAFSLGISHYVVAATANTQYTPMEKIPGTESAKDFPSYVKAIYKFGIWTIGIAAMLMIMIGGFMYMTSAGNNATMGKAKGYITDALIGLVMAMTAYLLLFTINPDLVNISIKFPSGSSSSSSGSNASKIAENLAECKKECSSKTGDELTACNAACEKAASAAQSSGGAGNGTCNTISTGDCSEENLKNTCFGSNASQASSICNVESRGDKSIKSGVDVCADGNSASYGLFQINITAHKVGGLDCPSAFSGGAYTSKNHSCTVTNQSLYNQCVAAATDPATNIATACSIGNNGAKWGQWGANSKCGFNR